jgi:hypothetical protein
MQFRFRLLFVVVFIITGFARANAQDVDYLKHKKLFCLCSIKRECFHCYACEKERYQLKIENRADKKITKIFYKFYSPVFNCVLEKVAKIQGGVIDPKQTGLLHICVVDGRYWIISKIVYDDETEATLTLHDRIESFPQEADECDCNPE